MLEETHSQILCKALVINFLLISQTMINHVRLWAKPSQYVMINQAVGNNIFNTNLEAIYSYYMDYKW